MRIQVITSLEDVSRLLSQCDLPDEDISRSRPLHFFGISHEEALAGVVGLELYPPVGLLRSLAVCPSLRGRGLGHALVAHAESFSVAQGIQRLFLLTTTAEKFFQGLGYLPFPRDEAPVAIRGTSQFAGLCPASAALLVRTLAE